MKLLARTAFLLTAVCAVLVVALAEDKPKAKITEYGVSVYKMGEVNATDEKAGDSFDRLLAYMNKQVEGSKFLRRGIRNKSDAALTLLRDEKATSAMAFVSPNFYLKNRKELSLTLLAEAQRKSLNGERYVLIGKTELKKYPNGKRIATNLDDGDWLDKVILPVPEGGKAVNWILSKNIFDSLYEIEEEEEGAPDFVLVDMLTLQAVEKDQDLKKLPRSLESDLLPQDLVVEIDGRLGDRREAVKKLLKELDQSDEGKKAGEAIQVPKFTDADETRINAAAEKLNKAAK